MCGRSQKIVINPPELLDQQFSPNLFHVTYLHNKAGSCYTALIFKFLTWVKLDDILKKGKTEIKNFKKDHLLYILGLVQRIQSCNKEYRFYEYVPIKAAYVQDMIHNYKDYIEFAKDSGILECDNIYIEGEKCYGYKFSEQYDTTDTKGVKLTDLKVIKKIKKR